MNEQKGFFTGLGAMLDRRLGRPRELTTGESRLGRIVRWFLPNGGTLLLVALLIFTVNVWAKPLLNAPNAPGPSATTIHYQGRLADSGGAPLDGNYGMRFALYDALTGGNLVWGPELHDAVPVSDGLFSVGLGSQTSGGIPIEVWTGGDRYLEVTVGGETLSPRELIRSVPVAGMALTVPDGSITQASAPSLVESLTDNAQIQYGQVRATASENTDRLSATITFSPSFSSRPALVVQPWNSYTPYVIVTLGIPCDGDSCEMRIRRADGGSWVSGQFQDIQWVAIGQD